ncbi:hypothetical protein ACFU44_24520 [Nocardia rhizosphaerihabitans]
MTRCTNALSGGSPAPAPEPGPAPEYDWAAAARRECLGTSSSDSGVGGR